MLANMRFRSLRLTLDRIKWEAILVDCTSRTADTCNNCAKCGKSFKIGTMKLITHYGQN